MSNEPQSRSDSSPALPWRFEQARTRVIVRDAHGDLLFTIEGAGRKPNAPWVKRRDAALWYLAKMLGTPQTAPLSEQRHTCPHAGPGIPHCRFFFEAEERGEIRCTASNDKYDSQEEA